MSSDVVIGLFSKGWRSADFVTALQYAEDQHWLKKEGGRSGCSALGSSKLIMGDGTSLAAGVDRDLTCIDRPCSAQERSQNPKTPEEGDPAAKI